MKVLSSLAVLPLLLALGRDARAEPAYRLDPSLDVPIVLVGGAMTASFFFLDEAPGVACGVSCDRSKVNVFDRWAAGRYSAAWSTIGDIATGAAVGFGPLVLLLDQGLSDGANDLLVVGEATLLSSALQVTASYAVSRPRPRVYSSEAPLEDRVDANAARSFFSGHVADAVASTVATTVTFHRLGKHRLGWLVLAGGLAGSAVSGTGRVLSGGHFPSDVLIGAAVGTGFGLLLPRLHGSRATVAPYGAGAMITGTW